MKTTGEFTIYRYVIKIRSHGKPYYLIPFGDIHWTAPLCHREKWLEFLQWAKEKKNCYFLGMGDYLDLASTSERPILSHPALHESTKHTLEKVYMAHIKDFCKEISFMKGKLIGLIEGNHYSAFEDGTTSTQRMCAILGCKYLGVSSFIRLVFDKCNSQMERHTSMKLDIWAHHGASGGRSLGASINKVEQMIKTANADIYLMGHDHKKQVGFMNVLELGNSNKNIYLKNKKILMARTGSFLKGYEPGHRSYIADSAMSPTDLGVIKIELTPKNTRKVLDGTNIEQRYIDIHASI